MLARQLASKYMEEFNADMLFLLQEMTPASRLHVRELAYQVCPIEPDRFFGNLYNTFFKPFIKEYEKVDVALWNLSIPGTCILDCTE